MNSLETALKTHGFSVTRSRQTVFRALQGHEPQTMHELILACSPMDRATIYRIIMLFERLGIVQRLQIGWKYKLELSDQFHDHHHHMTCTRCGQSFALPEDETLESRLRALAANTGFVPSSHQIEIKGVCRNCRTIA